MFFAGCDSSDSLRGLSLGGRPLFDSVVDSPALGFADAAAFALAPRDGTPLISTVGPARVGLLGGTPGAQEGAVLLSVGAVSLSLPVLSLSRLSDESQAFSSAVMRWKGGEEQGRGGTL